MAVVGCPYEMVMLCSKVTTFVDVISSFGSFLHVLLSFLLNSYSEELPSRCKKEIIYAAANAESHRTGKITIEGFNKILQNICASNVSKSDVQLIVDELGEDSDSQSEHTIQVAKMLQIL